MSVHITEELEQELIYLAQQSETTPDELAQGALQEFVAHRRDLNDAVRRSNADFTAGRVLSHEEVFARIQNQLQTKAA